MKKFYLRDLLSVLKNGPPPLEKTGEEEFDLPDERGAGVDTHGQGVDTDLPKVDSLLAKIRERQEQELNRLKEQINSYSTQTKKGNEHSAHDLPGAEHKASLFRRDFKIAGQIGEPGQPEKLSDVSLINQIDAGLKRGYDESEVVKAVIKAISPNSSLRSYILTLPERSLKKLRKILRVFYQERNAADLYQELVTTCQGSKETPQQYLLRALDARNKVLFAGKEEGNGQDYSHQLVQNAFLRTFETGLRDETILVNIRPLLRTKNVTDEKLMRLVNDLSSLQTQRKLKIGTQTKVASVTESPGAVQSEMKTCKTDTNQLGRPFAEIKELRAELASLKIKQGVNRVRLTPLHSSIKVASPRIKVVFPYNRIKVVLGLEITIKMSGQIIQDVISPLQTHEKECQVMLLHSGRGEITIFTTHKTDFKTEMPIPTEHNNSSQDIGTTIKHPITPHPSRFHALRVLRKALYGAITASSAEKKDIKADSVKN